MHLGILTFGTPSSTWFVTIRNYQNALQLRTPRSSRPTPLFETSFPDDVNFPLLFYIIDNNLYQSYNSKGFHLVIL